MHYPALPELFGCWLWHVLSITKAHIFVKRIFFHFPNYSGIKPVQKNRLKLVKSFVNLSVGACYQLKDVIWKLFYYWKEHGKVRCRPSEKKVNWCDVLAHISSRCKSRLLQTLDSLLPSFIDWFVLFMIYLLGRNSVLLLLLVCSVSIHSTCRTWSRQPG